MPMPNALPTQLVVFEWLMQTPWMMVPIGRSKASHSASSRGSGLRFPPFRLEC